MEFGKSLNPDLNSDFRLDRHPYKTNTRILNTNLGGEFYTLLEKFLRISLYVTDDAIASYVT